MLAGFMVWSVIDDIIYHKNEKNETIEDLVKKRKIYRNLAIVLFFIYGLSGLACIWFINWIIYIIAASTTITAYVIFSIRSEEIDKISKYYLLIPTLLMFSYFKAKSELNIIKEKRDSINVVLNFENKTVKNDIDNHYLGKTKNYTFFYNSKSKKSTIYSNSEILSIEINN